MATNDRYHLLKMKTKPKPRLSMKLLWQLNLKYLESQPAAPNIAGFLLFVDNFIKFPLKEKK